MICANACGEMKIQEIEKTIPIKGVDITGIGSFYVCPICGLEIGTIEQAGAFQKVITSKYNELQMKKGTAVGRKYSPAIMYANNVEILGVWHAVAEGGNRPICEKKFIDLFPFKDNELHIPYRHRLTCLACKILVTTPSQIKLDLVGRECPHCGEIEDTIVTDGDFNRGRYIFKVGHCGACNKAWHNVYEFVRSKNIEDDI